MANVQEFFDLDKSYNFLWKFVVKKHNVENVKIVKIIDCRAGFFPI